MKKQKNTIPKQMEFWAFCAQELIQKHKNAEKPLLSVFFMFWHKNAEKTTIFGFLHVLKWKMVKDTIILPFCDFVTFFLIKSALVCCAGTSCKRRTVKLDVCLNICFLCLRSVVTFSSRAKDKAISVKLYVTWNFFFWPIKRRETLPRTTVQKIYLPELQILTFLRNTGHFTHEWEWCCLLEELARTACPTHIQL
jgi:hypothetical protein